MKAADRGKRRIALRRIAERDGATTLQLACGPAGDFAHNGGMRDDGDPAVFVLGLAGVVFFDPVRFEDNAVARFDEVVGEFKRSDGGLDLLTKSDGIVIAGFAAEDGDFGRAERRGGERVHVDGEYLRGARSLCNAAATDESLAYEERTADLGARFGVRRCVRSALASGAAKAA